MFTNIAKDWGHHHISYCWLCIHDIPIKAPLKPGYATKHHSDEVCRLAIFYRALFFPWVFFPFPGDFFPRSSFLNEASKSGRQAGQASEPASQQANKQAGRQAGRSPNNTSSWTNPRLLLAPKFPIPAEIRVSSSQMLDLPSVSSSKMLQLP